MLILKDHSLYTVLVQKPPKAPSSSISLLKEHAEKDDFFKVAVWAADMLLLLCVETRLGLGGEMSSPLKFERPTIAASSLSAGESY